MIIGNKNIFALDFRLYFKDESSIFFQSNVWISGQQVTSEHEEVVLFQLLYDLEAIISLNGKRTFEALAELDTAYFYSDYCDAVFMGDSNHKYYDISQKEHWVNAHIELPPIANFGCMWLIDGDQKSTVIIHDDASGTSRYILPKGYVDDILVELMESVGMWLKSEGASISVVPAGSHELIGDKKTFAAELELGMPYDGRLFGKICYWVSGVRFGEYTFTWLDGIEDELRKIANAASSREKRALFLYPAHDLYYNYEHTVVREEQFHPCWEKSIEEHWGSCNITPNIAPQFDGITVLVVDSEGKSKIVAYDFDSSLVECVLGKGEVDMVIKDTIGVVEKWHNSTKIQAWG